MLQSGTEFSRQEFERLTVEELRKICKENGISYYEGGKRLNKGSIIDKLLDAVVEEKIEDAVNECVNQAVSEEVEEEECLRFLKEEQEKAERLERKKKYIEQANVGSIVAFKLPSGRVISAAVTKKSTNGRKFLVETKYGAEFKISFDDVLWVRTNKRWPKGIYLLFKKNIRTEVNKDGEEIN